MSLETYFQNKKILVTSAGKGIGRALVERLHSYGAVVYATSTADDNLSGLEKDFPFVKTICIDLNNWDDTRIALQDLDTLDGVINNSTLNKMINNIGVAGMQPALDITQEKFDEVSNVCLKAVLNVCQMTAPKMIEAGNGGSIVNVSTSVARATIPNCASYRASKAALDELTKSLAYELAKHNIRVNTVTLGCVWTNAFKRIVEISSGKSSPGFLNQAIQSNSTVGGDPLVPMEDVVNTILFVLSNLSSKMSGGNIILDAGMCAA